MNENQVHEEVIKWVANTTGLTVIKTHQGEGRPRKPYIAVNLLNISQVREFYTDLEYTDTGQDNGHGNNQISVAPVIETEWELSMHSYGDQPTTPLRMVRSIAQVAGPQQKIDKTLSVFDVGTINNVPDHINEKWEPRAHSRLFVRGYVRDGFLIDVIDEAPVTVTRNF